MEDMKWDMGGAGAVAGVINALALRKAKAHVVGICGLVENMPDGNAQRPGDIVTSMSGQDHRGAEHGCGRATCSMRRRVVGSGKIRAGDDHRYRHAYWRHSYLSWRPAWRTVFQTMTAWLVSSSPPVPKAVTSYGASPLSEAYDKLLDSPIADMKNIGPRFAGSITAAQFIKRFIKDGVKWAHLDIAGMVWADKPGATWDKGATGYGVRLIDQLIADNFELS